MSEEFWSGNYFNYFTEVEERFQRARGTGLFLFSPLDWALVEGWKNAGVPLEAVLRGVDEAFEKWRAKKQTGRAVNSLAYCAQAVVEQAQILAGTAAGRERREAAPPFDAAELCAYLEANAARLRHPPFEEIAATLDALAAATETHYQDLEDLERRLTALEDKMTALARSQQKDEDLVAARREFDFQIRPYRRQMTADQIATLERRFLDRRLLESAGLPRLSLFYLK